MADDPNRDIWPVREGFFCVDTCRSSIDPKERHIVCKLDRYQLEDRYLRLLDEANNLKKLSNAQEDKIKRLTTKLMRVTANPRACQIALDVYEDKNKIIALEVENSKLKDKISVLRNQLLSHTIVGRSSSRSRNPQARPSSGRITCRSESSRTKIPSCHCIVQTASDDSNARASLEKIEELEAQKEELSERVGQLERELSVCSVLSQKQKVAENVEYIRVWRQMKQLNDKLAASEAENVTLNAQINDLKRMLKEKAKNNEEITTELLTEKKRMADVDELMLKAKESELALREKDEQIRDLVNEMKILQQHNNELIDLSAKYGQVEQENKELKKEVVVQCQDQENLRSAFHNEQANLVALQTSNGQLLGKLEELQKNIDTLTVQLTSFQTQTDRQEPSIGTQATTKQPNVKIPIIIESPVLYKDTSIQVEKCSKCCAKEKPAVVAEKIQKCQKCCDEAIPLPRKDLRLADKSVQTEGRYGPINNVGRKDQATSIMTPVKEKSRPEPPQTAERQSDTPASTTQALSPEEMLSLLEQAQIKPTDTFSPQKTVDDILDEKQRRRQVVSLEKLLFGDSSC